MGLEKSLSRAAVLAWSEYLHDFIVLHQAHSRLLVSIQRYFGSVIKNNDISLFFTSINYLKKLVQTGVFWCVSIVYTLINGIIQCISSIIIFLHQ